MEKGTISMDFVAEALLVARQRGLDIAALVAGTGLSPELLAIPQARVSPEQYGALWHALADALNDEFFGMDSHPMRRGSFAILCHALLDCPTVGRAIERALRFFALVLDDLSGQLRVDGARAEVVLADRGPPGRLFAHGTLFVVLYGVACWLGGRRLPLMEVNFCQPSPPNLAEYRLVFGNTLHFGAAASALALDARLLGLPVIRDAAALRVFLRQAPANFLVKYRSQAGDVARIRGLLSERPLAEWPSFEALAGALHTTPSTLRRRLEREGSSFQVIKDDLRRDMAIDLLCNSTRSVDDIGFALGFSEHSAFYRAFRRWTGASPGEYRGKTAGFAG